MPFENIVGKGENAGYHSVSYFIKKENCHFSKENLSSGNGFNLVQPKMLSFGITLPPLYHILQVFLVDDIYMSLQIGKQYVQSNLALLFLVTDS